MTDQTLWYTLLWRRTYDRKSTKDATRDSDRSPCHHGETRR
jgi:hypothetical protein